MLEALDEPVQGLVVASPANPTGTMLAPAELAALATWCEEHGVQLISDEIYHGIEYASPRAARLGLGDLARGGGLQLVLEVLLDDRLADRLDAGAPSGCAGPVDVLTGNFTICPPVLSQHAAVAAFTDASYAECDGHVARYAENRRLLLDGLPRLGIDRLAPADGAFYVYADVGHLTDDSMAFCHRLLAETGIATAPGVDFDTEVGNRFVRLSFAGSTDDVAEALARLERLALGSGASSGIGLAPQVDADRGGSLARTSRGRARWCARAGRPGRSSASAIAAAAIPDTAECTIAGALRLEKLPALPQPSAVKPRAQSRACGTSSRRASVRGST